MFIIHGMNNSHLLPRALQGMLELALRSFPVVVVIGSRQTGKSTLVRQHDRVTLDEVQRSPDLLLTVKRAVDERRSPGRAYTTTTILGHHLEGEPEKCRGRAFSPTGRALSPAFLAPSLEDRGDRDRTSSSSLADP